MKNILIVYFSMGGHTRTLAEEIRAAIGAGTGADMRADIEEISERRPRCGMSGMLRALWDAMLRRKSGIHPPKRDPAGYDLLILGGPIWAGRLATPVRTFAEQHGPRARDMALFCTEGGRGAEKAFADLERLAQKQALATLVVDARHLSPMDHRSDLGRFIAALSRRGGGREGDGHEGGRRAREAGQSPGMAAAWIQTPRPRG